MPEALVRPYVHVAVTDAWVSFEVGAGKARGRTVPCLPAGRRVAEMEIPGCGIHEMGIGIDVARTGVSAHLLMGCREALVLFFSLQLFRQ